MSDYQFILTETFDDGQIVRISMNRPAYRNAQNRGMLVELDEAFTQAEADDRVRVVILAGKGKAFSAGHDLGTPEQREGQAPGPKQHVTFQGYGGTYGGAERMMQQERHFFFRNTMRWRNLQKITIAQVHGQCYAAALMLAWACDLIVAAEDTEFAEVVGTRLGMCGVEYFGHPWELGPRKAKELLLTGDSFDAQEAHRLGMVSKIFPADRLEEDTLTFARRIAKVPTVAAALIKESVNQAQDSMGFYNALNSAFALHQLNHAHWAWAREDRHPIGSPELGVPSWRDAPPLKPAVVSQP